MFKKTITYLAFLLGFLSLLTVSFAYQESGSLLQSCDEEAEILKEEGIYDRCFEFYQEFTHKALKQTSIQESLKTSVSFQLTVPTTNIINTQLPTYNNIVREQNTDY